jgi:hypothetical protein
MAGRFPLRFPQASLETPNPHGKRGRGCPSPFPSYSEALGAALRALPTEEVGMMVDHQPHGRMSAPEAEFEAAR